MKLKNRFIYYIIAVSLSLLLAYIAWKTQEGPYLSGFSTIIAFPYLMWVMASAFFTGPSSPSWAIVTQLYLIFGLYHCLIFLPILFTSSFRNKGFLITQFSVIAISILLSIIFTGTMNALLGV